MSNHMRPLALHTTLTHSLFSLDLRLAGYSGRAGECRFCRRVWPPELYPPVDEVCDHAPPTHRLEELDGGLRRCQDCGRQNPMPNEPCGEQPSPEMERHREATRHHREAMRLSRQLLGLDEVD